MLYKGKDIRHYVPHVDETVEGFLTSSGLNRLRGFQNRDIVAWDVERLIGINITKIIAGQSGHDLQMPADTVKKGQGTAADIAILTATCLNILGVPSIICVCEEDACCLFTNAQNVVVCLHKQTVMHPSHRQAYCHGEHALYRFNGEKCFEK